MNPPASCVFKSSSANAIHQAPMNLRWAHRPSILASAKEDPESSDHHVDGEQLRPWADIARPLLYHLLPRVSLLEQVRLSAVCGPWRDFLADHPSLRHPRFPWMMRPTIDNNSVYEIFCLSENSSCTLRLPVAAAKYIRCVAASHGWLFFYDGLTGGFLINPITKTCIDLPTASPRHYSRDALSAAPTEPGCIVLRLISHPNGKWVIYYCRIGDKTWHVRQEDFWPISNVTVMDGKFYVLCREGLAEMDFNRRCSSLRWIKINDDAFTWRCLNVLRNCPYLVESNGELLLVTLLESLLHCEKRDEFLACVYKADLKNKIWAKVDDLQGRSLFLSHISCFSLPVPATDAREHAGGDCVYATTRWPWSDYAWPHQEKDRPWHEYRVCRGFLDQCPPHGFGVQNCNSHHIWFMPAI